MTAPRLGWTCVVCRYAESQYPIVEFRDWPCVCRSWHLLCDRCPTDWGLVPDDPDWKLGLTRCPDSPEVRCLIAVMGGDG